MPAGLDGNANPVVTAARTRVLELVTSKVVAIEAGRPVLVGIDGASGSGKSTFADELAGTIAAATARIAVRASIDSFHQPRARRYRRGAESAEGYYRDSHDLPALEEHLLDSFRTGAGTFRRGIFDEPADQARYESAEPVRADSILVFDGLFLHRDELVEYWDLTVFLIAEARREMAWQSYLTTDLPHDPAARDAEIARRVTRARRERYVEGQALYEREAAPQLRADVVIDNDDLAHPRVIAGAVTRRRPTH